MSTLKVIAIVFLSLFLSLSLFIFGFLFTMKMTALNANFVTSQLDSLPVSSLVDEAELSKIKEENPELADLIENIIIENEAELKEQAGEAIHTIYDYLKGRSENLDLALILKNTILDPYGLEMPSDVDESLEEVESAFGESRRYVGYFNLVYGLLIGFIVLLIAGIILVYREVKGATRTLGTIFLVYGIANIIAVFVARGVSRPPMERLDVPLSIQTWLTQLTSSSLTPLLILAIVLLIVGAVLLTVSFIYKRRQTPIETETPL